MAIDAANVSPLTTEAILGLDFLREHKALIDIPQRQLYLGDKQCTLPLREPVYGQPLSTAYGQPREQERDCRTEIYNRGRTYVPIFISSTEGTIEKIAQTMDGTVQDR